MRSQRLAILEYARAHDFRIDDFIEATASGQASEKRRRLDELTSVLQRGDRLVVSELSRLGRSLGQIVTILDALAKAGVAFVALKENIRVDGERDIQTKVMTTLFALFAEVERDLISERTREGLARARSSGRKLARRLAARGCNPRRLHDRGRASASASTAVPAACFRARLAREAEPGRGTHRPGPRRLPAEVLSAAGASARRRASSARIGTPRVAGRGRS